MWSRSPDSRVARACVAAGIGVWALSCAQVDEDLVLLVPVPENLDGRPLCAAIAGVDTLVLELFEVEILDPALDVDLETRLGGLCTRCDSPDQLRCTLRQRVCRCVDPGTPWRTSAELNAAVGGVRLDLARPDALTCVRVSGFTRSGIAPEGSCTAQACPGALDDVGTARFCGLTSVREPGAASLPATPSSISCSFPDVCGRLLELCSAERPACAQLEEICRTGAARLEEICTRGTALCDRVGQICEDVTSICPELLELTLDECIAF